MRTAIGLTALAAGAILTFAVSVRVPGVNLALAGLIIMAAAIAGMIGPVRAADWLRRRGVRLPSSPYPAGRGEMRELAGDPDDDGYPAYLLQDPAVLAAEVLRSVGADGHTDGRSDAA